MYRDHSSIGFSLVAYSDLQNVIFSLSPLRKAGTTRVRNPLLGALTKSGQSTATSAELRRRFATDLLNLALAAPVDYADKLTPKPLLHFYAVAPVHSPAADDIYNKPKRDVWLRSL